jgi:hypothetical protein
MMIDEASQPARCTAIPFQAVTSGIDDASPNAKNFLLSLAPIASPDCSCG